MEKAILKTLIYADIFDYPLTVFEIHKWLIGRKANLRQVEKTLESLYKVSGIKYYGRYYFLPRRNRLVGKRLHREKQSQLYFKKAKMLSQILKLIPWIKLVGISGGLAVNNASKKDDIDLFIITAKNRLWISRLLTLGLLSLTGQRRKKGDQSRRIVGKLCINILLEEDKLEQQNKDIFIAHELLQMKVLWQRGGVYSKYLEDNDWAFKFLPNWVGNQYQVSGSKYYGKKHYQKTLNTQYIIHNTILDVFEKLARKFQLWYMRQPKGMERIEDGALYFHPKDCRSEILAQYKQRIKLIISP